MKPSATPLLPQVATKLIHANLDSGTRRHALNVLRQRGDYGGRGDQTIKHGEILETGEDTGSGWELGPPPFIYIQH